MIQEEVSTLIKKIKMERELQKIFSNEMASYLKISDKTYTRIEKQETDLSIEHFFLICKRLKRKPEYFFGGGSSVYFQDCYYSGNNNVYNLSELSEDNKKTLLALGQMIVQNTQTIK